MYKRKYTHTYIQPYIHTYIHTTTHTHKNTLIHTYTHDEYSYLNEAKFVYFILNTLSTLATPPHSVLTQY